MSWIFTFQEFVCLLLTQIQLPSSKTKKEFFSTFFFSLLTTNKFEEIFLSFFNQKLFLLITLCLILSIFEKFCDKMTIQFVHFHGFEDLKVERRASNVCFLFILYLFVTPINYQWLSNHDTAEIKDNSFLLWINHTINK